LGALAACDQPDRNVKSVAIATLMSHPALDQVQAGIRTELEARGWKEGKTIKYIERNANQQIQVLPTIANDLVAQNPDVIVAITTPAAQALRKVARGPLVFAAVTDPVGAGLIPDLDKAHAGITGTSDAWPYQDQIALIREILPNAKTLGVLYNPGEAASQYGITQIRKYAPAFGFKLIEGAVNTVGDVRPVAENIAPQADVLLLSSDNTVIGGVVGALKTAFSSKKPLFVGDSGTVEKGGLAAVSVGYFQLGKETGALVARMLQGERTLAPVVARGSELHINTKAAELMGVTLPATVLSRATKVYDGIAQ
jgi:putative ABC transport system substrate-binding protein